MSTDKHPGGRPATGTGGHAITLRESNKTSNRIVIGKELWRAIGSPRRVTISRRGGAIHIAPTTSTERGVSYAVSGPPSTAPRVSIGIQVCTDDLKIFAPARYEAVEVRRGEIVVFV